MYQPLDFAILSMLTFQPMTGYGLKKALDERIGHFWSTTQSHIYKSLKNLEEDNLVSVELVPQSGKPDRKVFSVTAEGGKQMHDWLLKPLQCDPVREAWLIQLFFAHSLSDEAIQNLFSERVQALDERCKHCVDLQEQTIKEVDGEPLDERTQALRALTYAYGQAFYKFQKEWHQKAILMLEKLD